jgi:3-oxoacyl-[acyl-carrier-protein] synthase-3
MPKARIMGVEHYVPEKVLSNFDLEKMVETNNEWILERTGIKERRILEPGMGTSDLLVPAIEELLKKRGITAEEIDAIVVGTTTPDFIFPSTGTIIQEKIGAKNAFAYDMEAACSGFVYALSTGAMYIESGRYKKVLVCGGDVMSSIIDYEDRATCIIFGDGAGVVLLEPTEDENEAIIDFMMHSDGSGAEYLNMKAGGCVRPASHETIENKWHYVYQDGKQVFKRAVKEMSDVSAAILKKHNLTGDDVDLFVAHQANLRIIEAAAKRMKLPDEKVMINIEKYGNTTAGTIPIALSEAVKEGKLKKGDTVVLAAFGGGYTWGSVLIKWGF